MSSTSIEINLLKQKSKLISFFNGYGSVLDLSGVQYRRRNVPTIIKLSNFKSDISIDKMNLKKDWENVGGSINIAKSNYDRTGR